MFLYHGTTVENALDILKNRVIKGKKASRKHKHRYVSFSENLLTARKFGEVVFQFEYVDGAFPVIYENKDWASEHPEITEYVLKNPKQLQEKKHLDALKKDKEHILINKHRFENEAVTIYLIGESMKDLNKVKKELNEYLNEEDTVKKSVKLYSDFTKKSIKP